MVLPFTQRTRVILGGAAIAFLALAGAFLGDRAVTSRLAAARAVADVARKEVVASNHRADSALALAAQLKASADSSAHASALAKAKADSAQRAADHFRGALAQVVKTAPDTCKPIVITADSALAADSSTIHSLHASAVADSAQIADLTNSRDSLTSALFDLRASSKTLVQADTKLSKAAKPSLILRLLPHPGVTVTYGLDQHGKPHAVAGISAGWSF